MIAYMHTDHSDIPKEQELAKRVQQHAYTNSGWYVDLKLGLHSAIHPDILNSPALVVYEGEDEELLLGFDEIEEWLSR